MAITEWGGLTRGKRMEHPELGPDQLMSPADCESQQISAPAAQGADIDLSAGSLADSRPHACKGDTVHNIMVLESTNL